MLNTYYIEWVVAYHSGESRSKAMIILAANAETAMQEAMESTLSLDKDNLTAVVKVNNSMQIPARVLRPKDKKSKESGATPS